MEKIVYLLGAGFSAPLGIPVMNDFYTKSVEIYESDTNKYAHFNDVFQYYDRMSASNGYYSLPLLNIEELLSMLEMAGELEIFSQKQNFTKYIVDVIRYCTPRMPFVSSPTNALQRLFGDEHWHIYGAFVSALLHHRFARIDETGVGGGIPSYRWVGYDDVMSEYSIVTLNYDTVLEDICGSMSTQLGMPIAFLKDSDAKPMHSRNAFLAKLHGSIDAPESIVSPTWNKSSAIASLKMDWKLAYKLLSDATQIRIIGYSLPATDSYIRYLLGTAIKTPAKLKRIDVICLDKHGDVKKRYDEFIRLPQYRFKNSSTESYLSNLRPHEDWPHNLSFSRIEESHSQFFQ